MLPLLTKFGQATLNGLRQFGYRALAARLRARWPWLLAAIILLLVSGWCHLASLQARGELLQFFEDHALRGRVGFMAYYYPPTIYRGGWSARPEKTLVQPVIDFSSDQHPEYRRMRFAVRWCALLNLPQDASFRLGTVSDDSSLILLDGEQVSSNPGLHGPEKSSTEVDAGAGPHTLEVLYYQHADAARMHLLFPQDLHKYLVPISGDMDSASLWRLNRQVQWWLNRRLLAAAAGAGLLFLLLLPYPATWRGRARSWLKGHWPHLALLAGLGGLLLINLNHAPGLEGDEGWAGYWAHQFQWKGIGGQSISWYATSIATGYPIYLLQKILPLDVGLVRLPGVLLNLLGLLFSGLAVERLLGKKAGWLAMLLLGSSAWFLCFSRTAWESLVYGMLALGLAMYGLAVAKEHAWGAALAGVAVGLGIYINAVFLALAAAVGITLVLLRRLRLFTMGRFWLGLGALVAGAWPFLWTFLGERNPAQADHGALLQVVPERIWSVLGQTLPHLLSGQRLSVWFSGEVLWPVPLVLPLAMLALMLSWPWQRPKPPAGPALAWLGLMALSSFLVIMYIAAVINMRIFEIPLFFLYLWTAIYLWWLMERGGWRAKLAMGIALLFVAGGLYVYVGNGLYAFSKSGGRIEAQVGREMSRGMHHLDTRGLYQRLVELDRPVHVPTYRLAQSLLFLEMEDRLGRRGLLMKGYRPGVVVVFFKGGDYSTGKAEVAGFMAEVTKRSGKTPPLLKLGPGLDDKFQAFIAPPDLAGKNTSQRGR
jgi:PA14 domain-containing protein